MEKDIKFLMEYVRDNQLAPLYNKIGNRLYKDFDISVNSAEIKLLITYIVNEYKNDRL